MADDSGAEKDVDGDDDPPRRVTRHVQPLGPRVLVRILQSPDRLESGLYVPAGTKDEHSEALMGEVVEVARTQANTLAYSDDDDDDDDDDSDDEPGLGANVSGIPLAARVLFGKEKGVAVPWDDSLRVVDVRHILAIVDEIPEDKIQ